MAASPDATITIDLDKSCTRCGKKGAADGGYCLSCVLVNLERKRMSKTTDTEQAQPSLIPLTPEELEAAGKRLAEKVRDLELLKRDHADERKAMKDARDELQAEISAIASTIRQHGR